MRYADSNTVIVSIAELATLVREILVNAGMSGENAQIVGEVVVAAERDGSRSYGIFRVPSMVEILRFGWVDGFATPTIVNNSTGLVLADGGNGFPQIGYAAGRGLLIEKARLQTLRCSPRRAARRARAGRDRLRQLAQLCRAGGRTHSSLWDEPDGFPWPTLGVGSGFLSDGPWRGVIGTPRWQAALAGRRTRLQWPPDEAIVDMPSAGALCLRASCWSAHFWLHCLTEQRYCVLETVATIG
jgi:delta1-piperideine-2-carboxylate reductase